MKNKANLIQIKGKNNIFSLVFSLCLDEQVDDWINEYGVRESPILKNIVEKLRMSWFEKTYIVDLTKKECRYISQLASDLLISNESKIYWYYRIYARAIALTYGKQPQINRFIDLFKAKWN